MKTKPLAHLIVMTFFAACAGSDKQADEPAPLPAEQPPAEEELPAAADTPAETPPTPEEPAPPPAPEAKKLSEDLDGDGTAEEISLTGAELKIGELAVALPADKLAGKTLDLKVIDLAKKDKARELVLVNPGVEDDAVWWIISYSKGKAGEPVEVPVGSEPTIKGDGSLTIVSANCGETTTTTWKLSKGKLTSGKPKKKGKHDETKCAG